MELSDLKLHELLTSDQISTRRESKRDASYRKFLVKTRNITGKDSETYSRLLEKNMTEIVLTGSPASTPFLLTEVQQWIYDQIVGDEGFRGMFHITTSNTKDPEDRRRNLLKVMVAFTNESDYIAFVEDFLPMLKLAANSAK